MTPEYIAGFFDGEGCVHCYCDRGYWYVKVTMSQKEPEVLYEIRDYFGCGQVYRHQRRGRYGHSLRIVGTANVKRFIKEVYPYSVVKRRKLRLAYHLCKEVKGMGNNPRRIALARAMRA